MKIGYQRVSTITQNLDRQTAALEAAGCDKIFTDKASGKNTHARPGLQEAMDAVQSGDQLVIAEWDRATRSMVDGINIMIHIHDKGGDILILDKPHLDTTSTIGRGVLALLSALAQDERERIVKRSIAGLKAAKARGVKLGRKVSLTKEQQREALIMLNDPDPEKRKTTREVGRLFKVSASTISRLEQQDV